MRLFLDANVLFSAAKSSGVLRAFLAELQADGHELIGNAYVVEEARRNIVLKFPEALADFNNFLQGLTIQEKIFPPLDQNLLPGLAEKDRPVLAGAMECRCDALVTGDKTHFGAFYGRTVQGVTIHSPASLAHSLRC